jgi:hypothetical protein
MNEKQQEEKGPETLLAAWMESVTELWGSMAQKWSTGTGASDMRTPPKKGAESRAQEGWQSALKMWQTLSSSMAEPGTMDTLFKGINALPEILMKMVQTGWDGYFHLQQQWMERVGRIEKSTEAYKFENLDQDAFKAWMEIYEKEFRQFLNIPPLGLTRFYQERMARFADKFNLLQGTIAEFMYLVYLPMEKSLKVMQEKLEALTKDGKLPENSQDYYRMWLKILEGHYMTLFKSSEYTQVLSNTLNAMEDYMVARQELFRDTLQTFQMPTNKDMDDLYKELYRLKKRVKQLEKGSRK